MRLYLSSYRIPVPEALFELFDKKPADIQVGIIPNAKDYYAERARNFKINEMKQSLQEYGFTAFQVIDLREYSRATELEQDLSKVDMLWVSGGNTFCLREEMKNSGFEDVIQDHLNRGLVYVGESAGAAVVGNSLKGIEFADEPAFAATTHWGGLGIIDNYVLPHVGSPFFPESIDKAKEFHKDNPTLVELTDDQALVIHGDDRKIVTKSV